MILPALAINLCGNQFDAIVKEGMIYIEICPLKIKASHETADFFEILKRHLQWGHHPLSSVFEASV